jgi:aminoglycoside phosphotransferase (APT) family kinase protein
LLLFFHFLIWLVSSLLKRLVAKAFFILHGLTARIALPTLNLQKIYGIKEGGVSVDKNSERYKELRNLKVRLTPFTVEKISEAPSGPIAGILRKMGIPSSVSCEEIHGGRDSQVYKISRADSAYALRLLPSRQYEQFVREKEMIDIARANGVPVPNVCDIQVVDGHAAMLMEWGEGQPLLPILQSHPENAGKLGIEFGRVQARINRISVSSFTGGSRSWLAPSLEEAEILKRLPDEKPKTNLLHLDFHPLNVLTDGENITAVLDWANAAIGDFRFDIARTFSIMELAGYKLFEKNPEVLAEFEKGWRRGYEETAGPFERFKSMPIFYAWSGARLKRDSAERLEEGEKKEIDKWVAEWLD